MSKIYLHHDENKSKKETKEKNLFLKKFNLKAIKKTATNRRNL